MTINIKQEDIVDPFAVAPAGIYTIECTHGEQRPSKAGDDMIELRHKITDGGVEDIDTHLGKNVRDYMVISGDNSKYGTWRLSQYAQAADIDLDGCEAEDFIGSTFEVELSVEPPTPEFDSESNRIARVYVD